ncbi:MAG: hypothetical protein V1758_14060 [Pseudomonadota bacterium]
MSENYALQMHGQISLDISWNALQFAPPQSIAAPGIFIKMIAIIIIW